MENKTKEQLAEEIDYKSLYYSETTRADMLQEENNNLKSIISGKTFHDETEVLKAEIDILKKYLTSTGLADIDGNLIRVGHHLVDINNGNKYNIFRVKGGFAINTHQYDYNRNTPFYTSIADMQIAGYINGNCRIFNTPKQTKP